MRMGDPGDYGDYEENGDFVFDYSADYECVSNRNFIVFRCDALIV